MADISFTGNKKVKSIQKEFKEAYGATLRVYKGAKYADPDATLASLRAAGKKGGEIKINGNKKVGNFEKEVLEEYGIKIQIAKPDDSGLSDNDLTISAAGKEKYSVGRIMLERVAIMFLRIYRYSLSLSV